MPIPDLYRVIDLVCDRASWECSSVIDQNQPTRPDGIQGRLVDIKQKITDSLPNCTTWLSRIKASNDEEIYTVTIPPRRKWKKNINYIQHVKLPNNKRSTRIIIYNYNLDKVSVGYLSDNPEIRIFSPASDVKNFNYYKKDQSLSNIFSVSNLKVWPIISILFFLLSVLAVSSLYVPCQK